jgi:hypothetical protein
MLPDDVPPGIDHLIRSAIEEKRLLRFSYKGLPRIAEPHDYGVRKGKRDTEVFVYQVAGKSHSGRLPAWRHAQIDEISDLEVLDETFPGSRGTSTQRHNQWDVLLARVKD